MSKPILIAFLVSGILFSVLFPTAGMADESMDHHGKSADGCFAASIWGTDCPREGGVMSFLTFHLQAMKAIFADAFLLLMVAVAVLAMFLRFIEDFSWLRFFKVHESFSDPPNPKIFQRHLYYPWEKTFLRWITLHKKSDPEFALVSSL